MSTDQRRMIVMPNLAVGLCLVALGTVLVLDRLAVIEAARLLRFWPAALVLIGLSLVFQAFQTTDPSVRIQGLTTGDIIGLLVLGLIAWSIFARSPIAPRSISGDTTAVFAVMGRDAQVIRTPGFRGGEMTTAMGHSELDLRQTTPAPGEPPVIDVFVIWGGATIRVPAGWVVERRAAAVMGHARDRRRETPPDSADAPRIVVRGFVIMGGLDIRQ